LIPSQAVSAKTGIAMLRSALQSSLSGISAASLAVNVTANNLANSQTDGFKSSRVVFADQSSRDPGSSPDRSTRGSLNSGDGVTVADIQVDHSTYSVGHDSGMPSPVNHGATQVVAGAKEFSNTDIARELVNLTHYSTMFRANLRVLETSNELLDELFRLRRR
jgi:flagellar hook protein FlgE